MLGWRGITEVCWGGGGLLKCVGVEGVYFIKLHSSMFFKI